MKILRTISSFYPCIRGPIKQAFKVSSELENKGIASPILTTYFGADNSPAQGKIDNVYVVRYKNQARIMKYFISLGLIKGLLQECDIIHSHEYNAFQSDLAWFIANIRRKPFVISTHGNLLCYKYIFKKKLPKFPYIIHDFLTLKSAAKRANTVIVSSNTEYNDAVTFGIEKKKIVIIPPGIDEIFYNLDVKPASQQDNEVPKEEIKLLFVGRLSRDRNLETILFAIKDLSDVVFYIVGGELGTSGSTRHSYTLSLKALAAQLGIGDRVKFIGQQSGNDLIKWYKTADIFINTSKYESFGQSILEAAACGLPIISTPVGIANEIIKDSYTGFIVSSNPSSIAVKVKELADKNLKKEFGSRLQESVRKKYAWDQIIDRYISVYEKLIC